MGLAGYVGASLLFLPAVMVLIKKRIRNRRKKICKIIPRLIATAEKAKCIYGDTKKDVCTNPAIITINMYLSDSRIHTDCTAATTLLQMLLYKERLISLPRSIRNSRIDGWNLYNGSLIKNSIFTYLFNFRYEHDNTLKIGYLWYAPFTILRKLGAQMPNGYHNGWYLIGLGYKSPSGKPYHEQYPHLWYGKYDPNKVCCLAFFGEHSNGESSFIITHVETLRETLIEESNHVWKDLSPYVNKFKTLLCGINEGVIYREQCELI